MPSLTPTETLPLFSAASPQDIRQASERMMQFWAGALLPLWTPFWAASAFGIGAWSLSRSLDRAGLLNADLPKVAGFAVIWPGFGPKPAETLEATADVVEDVIAASKVTAYAVLETQEAVVEEATDAIAEVMTQTVAEVVSTVEDVAEMVAAPLADAVPDVVEPQVLIDPVTAAPVVPEVVEALAEVTPPVEEVVEPMIDEAVAPPVKPAAKAMPKPIARDLAVAKEAEPAPKRTKPNRPRPKA